MPFPKECTKSQTINPENLERTEGLVATAGNQDSRVPTRLGLGFPIQTTPSPWTPPRSFSLETVASMCLVLFEAFFLHTWDFTCQLFPLCQFPLSQAPQLLWATKPHVLDSLNRSRHRHWIHNNEFSSCSSWTEEVGQNCL